MSIDLIALRKVAAGDPESKIAVKRAWLAEVLRELEAARQASDRQANRDAVYRKAEDILSGLGGLRPGSASHHTAT